MSCSPHLSLSESARLLGKHQDFFVKLPPKLNRLMRILGKGDIRTGATVYFRSTDRLRVDMGDMYNELFECKSITRFFEDTVECNPYKSPQSFTSTLRSMAFTITDRTMKFCAYEAGKRTLKLYNEWKQDGFSEAEKKQIREMYV